MDDRSLKGWAKIILKDRYGKEVKQDMSRKPRPNPLNATWEELGMRPGIRVPGTASWMAEWKRSPNQKKMIDYASTAHWLVQHLSEKDVGSYLKLYLSGKWDPEDEVKIAAAIRRSPTWEAKYNQMEESLMSKKQADVVKKASKKAEGASLKERIETLEAELRMLKGAFQDLLTVVAKKGEAKGGSRDRKHTKPETSGTTETKDVKVLLKELAAAKEAGDKQTAFKTRAKLRKAGYSLRANGKK